MSIWNKVLLVLIFLTATFYAVLISNRFVLNRQKEEEIAGLEKRRLDESSAVAKLRGDLNGDPLKEVKSWDDCGLNLKMTRLSQLIRGRMLVDCQAMRAPANKDGVVSTSFCLSSVDKPRLFADIHLSQDTMVYLFDSGSPLPKGGEGEAAPAAEGKTAGRPARFLGIFTVESINDEAKEINIVSVGTVTQAEEARMAESVRGGNSWIVCLDRLPVDSPDDLAYWLGGEDKELLATAFPEKDHAYFLKSAMTAKDLMTHLEGDIDSIDLEDSAETPVDTEAAPEVEIPADTPADSPVEAPTSPAVQSLFTLELTADDLFGPTQTENAAAKSLPTDLFSADEVAEAPAAEEAVSVPKPAVESGDLFGPVEPENVAAAEQPVDLFSGDAGPTAEAVAEKADIPAEAPKKAEEVVKNAPAEVPSDPLADTTETVDKKWRIPVDYEYLLSKRLAKRDELDLAILHREAATEDLDEVILSQLAMIGYPEVPKETLAMIGPTQDDAAPFAKKFAETKASFKVETFMAKKERFTDEVTAMESQRDLVKKRLDQATDFVAKIRDRITALVKENADLAGEIAKDQFEAADRIVKKSEVAASAGDISMDVPAKRDI